MTTADHIPDAGKMMPTEQDYSIDLAADLQQGQSLYKLSLDGLGILLRYGRKNSGPWCDREDIESGAAYLPDEDDAAAIVESGTAWPAAIRRALAAEAAILEWADARRETLVEVDELRPPSGELLLRNARSRLELELVAARIRAGREKGAQL